MLKEKEYQFKTKVNSLDSAIDAACESVGQVYDLLLPHPTVLGLFIIMHAQTEVKNNQEYPWTASTILLLNELEGNKNRLIQILKDLHPDKKDELLKLEGNLRVSSLDLYRTISYRENVSGFRSRWSKTLTSNIKALHSTVPSSPQVPSV